MSTCMTYFVLVKGYVAVGILTMPLGFRQTGDLYAALFLVFAGILSVIGARMLIQAR